VQVAEGLSDAGRYSVRIAGIRDSEKDIELCVAANSRAGKHAEAAISHMDLWNRVALRPIRAVVAIRQRCENDSHEDLAHVAQQILQRQTEQLISRQYGLAYPEDAEYVHEMRVAIRRLRAAMKVFRRGFAEPLTAESEQLRTIAAMLGKARDADVFIDFLQQYLEICPRKSQPLIEGLLACQKRERARHYRQLRAAFQNREHRLFFQQLYQCFQHPLEAKVAGRPGKTLGRRLRKVTDFGQRLEMLSPDQQHELRIACKKLRYTAEFFAHLYPPRLQRLVAVMTRMQDLLGTSHDADVYFDRLEEYARKQHGQKPGTEVTAALQSTRSYLRRMRKQALRDAVAIWKSFVASSTQTGWKKVVSGQ